MRRILLAIALAMFALDVAGLFTAAAMIAVSADDCAGCDQAPECTPGCDDCACCFHVRAMLAHAPLGARVIAPVSLDFTQPPLLLPPGDPREVFHIPKRANVRA